MLTPPLAERLGLKGRTGVRVIRRLDPSTPLQLGDVVLAVDGEAVRASTQNDDELFAGMIRRFRIGASPSLTVFREGKEIAVPVTLGPSPSQPREMKRYDDVTFEFRVSDVSEEDRVDGSVTSTEGVLVESVAARGWAALGRLNGGDLILSLDGTPVKDTGDFEKRMKDIHARKPESVVFELRRGIRTLFIEIQPAWK